MIPTKDMIYIGIILAMVGSAWYILEDWHYGPIRTLEKENSKLKIENKAQEGTIKNLGIRITELMANNKVIGFEEYFKGLDDANTTIITDNDKLIF